MSESLKQGISGFKVVSFNTKSGKDSEKLKLVVEANLDEIRCGEFDIGELLNALLNHKVGDSEIGLSVFISKK